MPTGSITVIVCCYTMDRWEKTLAALDSLAAQTLLPREVIVVVDGNADLAERMQAARGDSVQVVALPHNVGLSAARNAGVGAASSEWVAFLDDDAVAEPQWLELLWAACHDTGAVGSGGSAKPWLDDPELPRWFPGELLWTVGCSHRGLPSTRTQVRNVFGGCCLLRTDVVRGVGGFDENKGRKLKDMNGGEEADLCLRARQIEPDAFFVYEPRAVIHHYVPAQRLRARYLWSRCRADGRTKSTMASDLGHSSLRTELAFVARTPVNAALLVAQRRPRAAGVLLGGVVAAAWGALEGKAGQASRRLRGRADA